MMKVPPIPAACLALLLPALGQETATKWNVEIPPPVVREFRAEPPPAPEPIDYTVLASRTKRVEVTQAQEMPDLPPVTGIIHLTIQGVEDPGLPDLLPPLPALPPGDPAVLARMAEMRKTSRGMDLTFVSASVHDGKRSLIRIYPNGGLEDAVVAWSNLNALYLSGQGSYRVNHPDGTWQDRALLLGVSPVSSETRSRLAARDGRADIAPEIPGLPDVEAGGPAFVVIEGSPESPAMAVLEQIHDLFRRSGEVLKAQYLAREQARAERRAFLLANPVKPQDVTIKVWRRTRTLHPQQETR